MSVRDMSCTDGLATAALACHHRSGGLTHVRAGGRVFGEMILRRIETKMEEPTDKVLTGCSAAHRQTHAAGERGERAFPATDAPQLTVHS